LTQQQTEVRKPKAPYFRIILFLVVCGILGYVQNRIGPLVVADAAVMQLQDSDAAYLQFKGIQDLFRHFWILYVVTFIVVFFGYAKKLYQYNKGKDVV